MELQTQAAMSDEQIVELYWLFKRPTASISIFC